jgi:hypothetical protein
MDIDPGNLIAALTKAFGSNNESKNMQIDLMNTGEYSLPQFYETIVAPVLDEQVQSSANYTECIQILKVYCITMTCKMCNYSKVSFQTL